jgi:hypothetical protein
LVECQLPKLNVAGSNPVSRFGYLSLRYLDGAFFNKFLFKKIIMRIQKEMIEKIAQAVVHSLFEKNLIIWDERPEKLEAIVADVIVEDLMVEDRLNEEVKLLLESKTEEFERSMMDFGRVFQMVKSKLVRERNLIL